MTPTAETVRCSRCGRPPELPEVIGDGWGKWCYVGGVLVCVTCQTLKDLAAVLSDHEFDLGARLVCHGCGNQREPGEFWRGHFFDEQAAERALITPEPGEPAWLCRTCEPRVIHGIDD